MMYYIRTDLGYNLYIDEQLVDQIECRTRATALATMFDLINEWVGSPEWRWNVVDEKYIIRKIGDDIENVSNG